MRIAHMIDTLNTGGAQKLLVTFTREACTHAGGESISITVINLRSDSDISMADELVKGGAQVVTLSGRGLFDLHRLRRIYRFLRHERFDILQTHLSYANILGGITGRLAGVHVVATLHNADWDPRFNHPIRLWLEYWVLRNLVRRIVAVGEAVASAHKQYLPSQRLRVIPNATSQPAALSAEERKALRNEISGGLAGPLLISVGRLTAQKGYSDLLSAFVIVSSRHPQARLVIAGEGSLREELMAQISKLGIQEKACLLGLRQDVPRLLAACDLYVSSSHFEGLPVTILEAMRAGLPVVATQVGELPGVVIPGTGLLVSPHQPEQLAQAINTILEDSNRREAYSQAARLHVEANYGAGRWYEKYINLYHEVIQEG